MAVEWDHDLLRKRGAGIGLAAVEEGGDKETRTETVKLEPLLEGSGSEPGMPSPSPNGTPRKNVRFDHVEMNMYNGPGVLRPSQNEKNKKKRKKTKVKEGRDREESSSEEEVRRVREAWRRRRHSTGFERGVGWAV